MDKQGILLESGTNELEVLVFTSGETRYGVNVAKVREVVAKVHLVNVPMTNPAVVGVFKLRDSVIPLVDLQLYFDPKSPSEAAQRTVILMEFNDVQLGFLVDGVDRIYRMGWDQVRPMPTVQEDCASVITSVCETNGNLVLLVDFEKIAFEINGNDNVFGVAGLGGSSSTEHRADERILLAEDSPTIRNAIESNLVKSGYAQVTAVSDGGIAWETLEASAAGEQADRFTMVVTDIEMPRMDGLHLCKRIKEHSGLKDLPVVVFSSLVSDSNLKKCKSVGASAAITKPQMGRLVEILDKLVSRSASPENQTEEELLLAVD